MANRARQNRILQLLACLSDEQKVRLCSGDLSPAYAAVGVQQPADTAVLCGGTLQLKMPAGEDIWPQQQTAVQFPAPSALGCSFDEQLVQEVAQALAQQCRAAGIGMLMGPSLALQRDLRSGGFTERFSEDPLLAGSLAAAFVRGLRTRDVAACLTDYGCVDLAGAKHVRSIDADMQTLHALYLETARIALQEKPAAVMCAPSAVNGCAVCESDRLIRRTLREQFGFEGAVFRPLGGAEDAFASLAAGAALQMHHSGFAAEQLQDALQENEQTAQLLDEGALQALGLVSGLSRALPHKAGCEHERHRALARRAAAQCMVLLKNEDALLPFDDGQPFALIGVHAAQPPVCAQGSASLQPFAQCSLLEALQQQGAQVHYAAGCNADGSTNSLLIAEAKQALRQAGRGVLVLGLPQGAESTLYDRPHMQLPAGMLRLADILAAQGAPLAVVLMTGAPVELPFAPRMQALLFTGQCGETCGEAAADILLGRANPSGRLAFSWPRRLKDLPYAGDTAALSQQFGEACYVGSRFFDTQDTAPLYRFGHGLGYEDAEILSAAADKQRLVGEKQKITVRVALHNPGTRTLSTTLQLYAGQAGDALQTLAAYKKVSLLPDEHKFAEVEVPAGIFSVYDPLQDRRRLAAGSYMLSLAPLPCTEKKTAAARFSVQLSARDGYLAPPRPDRASLPLREFPSFRSAQVQQQDAFTLQSTLTQLRSTLTGRALAEELSLLVQETQHPNKAQYLAALMQLPVRLLPLYTRGVIDEKRVQRMLDFANRRFFRGIIHGFVQ